MIQGVDAMYDITSHRLNLEVEEKIKLAQDRYKKNLAGSVTSTLLSV